MFKILIENFGKNIKKIKDEQLKNICSILITLLVLKLDKLKKLN